MLVFEERGKLEYPEKNLLGLSDVYIVTFWVFTV